MPLAPTRRVTALLTAATLALPGCASMSRTETGAAIGAAAGTVAGAAVGRATRSTARGAIIGAVVGGAAGALIGRRMDQQARELERELENARVERVGEGIAVTFESGILFDFDSAQVRGAARDNLRDLSASLRKYPGTEVLFVGHTDSQGTDSYNQDLSERRARAAAQYLEDNGVARSRLRSAGRGETEPVEPNETDGGRQRNRRVEVAIFADEEYRREVQKEVGSGG